MESILSFGMGYLIGCISPAAWMGKRHHVDLKQEGTKNLGATNTMVVLGRSAGFFVMFLDVLKSYLSARVARALFPQLLTAGLIACLGVILGHCFPLNLHFQGGKGLAAFGGMIMSYKLLFAPMILLPGIAMILLLDTGVAMPVVASLMFPLLVMASDGLWQETLVAAIAGCLILYTHRDNIRLALEKKDFIQTRDFLKKILFKHN